MGIKVAAVAAIALLAGISGVLSPSSARGEAGRPIPPGLARVLADGAGRAAGGVDEGATCAWARDFVRRYGQERAVEIARLKYSDLEIKAWRRACFPVTRPIDRTR